MLFSNSSEPIKVQLWQLALLRVYPWRVLEKFLPHRRKERALSIRMEAFLQNPVNDGDLTESLRLLDSARSHAWLAQLLVLRAAKASATESEALSSGARQYLEEAEREISHATKRHPSYTALWFRSELRRVLGQTEASKKDLSEASLLRQSRKVERGKMLVQQATRALQKDRWVEARKKFKKAGKLLKMERGLDRTLAIVCTLEKVDEVLRLCHKAAIVTIGRARVRYHEYMVRLLLESGTLIADGKKRHLLPAELRSCLAAAYHRLEKRTVEALYNEALKQPEGGSYRKRLLKAKVELEHSALKPPFVP